VDYRSKIDKSPEVVEAYSKLSKIKIGQLYRHIKSGREYVFAGLKTMKFEGQWYDEVKYYVEHDSIPRHEFGRTAVNFSDSFEIIAGQYSYN